MNWFTKNANENDKGKRAGIEGSSHGKSSHKNSAGNQNSNKASDGRRPDSAEIRAQALANARMAREAIGEETLQKIAAAIQKKQMSSVEQAKACISQTDPSRVADEIIAMLDE
jgi:hypothetical protein